MFSNALVLHSTLAVHSSCARPVSARHKVDERHSHHPVASCLTSSMRAFWDLSGVACWLLTAAHTICC